MSYMLTNGLEIGIQVNAKRTYVYTLTYMHTRVYIYLSVCNVNSTCK